MERDWAPMMESEWRAANRRVRGQIDRSVEGALRRLNGEPDHPVELPVNQFEALGQAVRALQDAIVAAAESFRRGFTAVDRVRNGGRS